MARSILCSLGLLALCAFASAADADEGKGPRWRGGRNQLVVSPNGPEDGGDYGPKTPGTKTSGIQEAFDAAKAQAKDLYLAGGSWTADKTVPVVYNLEETLRIPWMQNFRLDSGHCVLNYTPKTGDAVVIDSQMSCAYRFGLIVSCASGAVVRMRPTTAGPDRFKVITSTEFVFNALVGGGGAWPGGEPYKNELDPARKWVGIGLWLDATPGAIDANKITVVETVGCGVGLRLSGAVTRNTIEEVNIHLCQDHIEVGGPSDPTPRDNRIEAFLDSQGIVPYSGAVVYGDANQLVLSCRPASKGPDLVFRPSADENLAIFHSPLRVRDDSTARTNRIVGAGGAEERVATPAVPPSGAVCRNVHHGPVEVRILDPGEVREWAESSAADADGWISFAGPLHSGQSFVLNPGEGVRLVYQRPPGWRWKAIR